MKILDHKLRIIPLDIHIDPIRPVDKAIITHAHADHARPGNKKVLATKETIEIMKLRYGNNCAGSFQAIKYAEKIYILRVLNEYYMVDVKSHPFQIDAQGSSFMAKYPSRLKKNHCNTLNRTNSHCSDEIDDPWIHIQ